MSIEAMKLALEAIQDLRGYRPDIDKAIDAIRTAIQQAEAQQPATPKPVVWNSIQIASWIGSQLMHEPSMFERATVCKFVRSLGRHPTLLKHSPKIHPAPSVPDDDFDLICNAIDKADSITMEGDYMLDSDDCIAVVRVMQVLLSVRAAMLASKEGGAT